MICLEACTWAEIDGINDAFITVLKELSLLFCSTDLNMPRDKYFDCYENLKGKQMLKLAFSWNAKRASVHSFPVPMSL